jgi:hypothetical protein
MTGKVNAHIELDEREVYSGTPVTIIAKLTGANCKTGIMYVVKYDDTYDCFDSSLVDVDDDIPVINLKGGNDNGI